MGSALASGKNGYRGPIGYCSPPAVVTEAAKLSKDESHGSAPHPRLCLLQIRSARTGDTVHPERESRICHPPSLANRITFAVGTASGRSERSKGSCLIIRNASPSS